MSIFCSSVSSSNCFRFSSLSVHAFHWRIFNLYFCCCSLSISMLFGLLLIWLKIWLSWDIWILLKNSVMCDWEIGAFPGGGRRNILSFASSVLGLVHWDRIFLPWYFNFSSIWQNPLFFIVIEFVIKLLPYPSVGLLTVSLHDLLPVSLICSVGLIRISMRDLLPVSLFCSVGLFTVSMRDLLLTSLCSAGLGAATWSGLLPVS